jgi:hypothetical protein
MAAFWRSIRLHVHHRQVATMKIPTALVLLLLGAAGVAHAQQFSSLLAPEVTGATGSGLVTVDYDALAHTLAIETTWEGLSGTTTVAHIHCCTAAPFTGTAGVAVTPGTLPGFPAGLNSGSYSVTLDLTQNATYTGGFLSGSGGTAAGAEARLIQGFYDGVAYFNVHSSTFGAGEIRGFLQPVPEPGTYALMALGLAAVAGAARRKRA